MGTFFKRFFAVCLVFVATSGIAFAAGSGAYRVEMNDARALSMAGAFVSLADSPAAVFYNPAGMTQIKGTEVSLSMALVQPKENAEPDGGTSTKMRRDSFMIPSTAVVSTINDKVSLGIGVTSSWGMGTNWAEDSFAKYVATRTTMTNEDCLLDAAYKVTDQVSLGAGVVVDNSSVDMQKKLNPFQAATSDGNFKLKGDGTGVGFQLGGLYKLNDKHQFGLQYNSEIRRTYRGKVYLDNLSPTIMGGYGFTSSSFVADVKEKNTLPQSIDVGYTYKPTQKLSLSADVMWMDWASVKENKLTYTSASNPYLELGNPTSRDWHGAWSVGLGTEYKAMDRLRLRGGYYFHQSPVPQNNWDPSMPDADSHSVAAGFGYDITKSITFDFAYSAMFYDSRTIHNAVGNASGASVNGTYSQWSSLVLATVSYKF